jgi:hypothetical protein
VKIARFVFGKVWKDDNKDNDDTLLTMKFLLDHQLMQTIMHPATSVWTVTSLPNGDIVSGTSDGLIRIFTRDPTRQASQEELQV